MNLISNLLLKSISFGACLALASCSEIKKESESPEIEANENRVLIHAKDFINSEGLAGFDVDDSSSVRLEGEKSWLTFEIEVPEAGRYITEIQANTSTEGVKLWIEDYVGNKDDRTYNITSSIETVANQGFTSYKRDGSPLNKGKHLIKLHVEGGEASIKDISFTLFKKHQLTPKTYTQKTDGQEWKVVWSDEFDYEGLPDSTKWIYDVGNWGWGNSELQYYTEGRKENARVENGNLIIEARMNDLGYAWTSARLTTRGKQSFLYGRIEFRAKVPAPDGNWAAGWMLGDEYVDELSWPYCGEIDILESVGFEMDDATGNGRAHASAHCGAYYFKLGNQPTGITDVENMNNEFHTYAVDWTPEGMTASVDGKTYFEYNDTATELSWPFNKPQNIILNLTMGGGWGGQRGIDSSATSQKYIVDYVRVYEKN
jgi:beta-glucanase (GH16 family)